MARRRKRRTFRNPPPRRSEHRFLRVARSDIARFRFLLEGWDNLALFTVVNPHTGTLLLRYSPHLRREVDAFLTCAGEVVVIEELPPDASG
jgi:hypothetical protein